MFNKSLGSHLLNAVAALALAACATRAPLASPTTQGASKPVWLVSNGFHAALVIRFRDAPVSWRQRAASHGAHHLLIGWGDAAFYRASRVTASMACRATFCVNPSAIHVLAFDGPVVSRFAHSDVIRLESSPDRFQALLRSLDAAFARDTNGQPIALGPGAMSGSLFYAGRERFYFPKVCNVWTAQMLRDAGFSVFVPTAITAGDLVWQVEKLGRREQWKRLPLDAF